MIVSIFLTATEYGGELCFEGHIVQHYIQYSTLHEHGLAQRCIDDESYQAINERKYVMAPDKWLARLSTY